MLCLSCHLAIQKNNNNKDDILNQVACLQIQEADVMSWRSLTLGKCPDPVGYRSSPLQFPQRLHWVPKLSKTNDDHLLSEQNNFFATVFSQEVHSGKSVSK